jgi:hypothetical protein
MSMTTTRDHRVTSTVPRSECARAFLDSLAAQDFAQLGDTLAADARLRALLPSGPREWAGAEVIAERFARWFGDTQDFELVEAAAGTLGDRLHLHWQLRLQAERPRAGWLIGDQHAYPDTGEEGRLARLDLLCTGYRSEGDHD